MVIASAWRLIKFSWYMLGAGYFRMWDKMLEHKFLFHGISFQVYSLFKLIFTVWWFDYIVLLGRTKSPALKNNVPVVHPMVSPSTRWWRWWSPCLGLTIYAEKDMRNSKLENKSGKPAAGIEIIQFTTVGSRIFNWCSHLKLQLERWEKMDNFKESIQWWKQSQSCDVQWHTKKVKSTWTKVGQCFV